MHLTTKGLVALCGVGALLGGMVVAGAGSAAAAPTTTWRVGCGAGSFTTIGAAVSAAASGGTVVVCPGTYDEHVTIPATKVLTLRGDHATINASTFNYPGVEILSSGSEVEGFTVENANGEGILVGALPGAGSTVTDVRVAGNTVENNDQGNPTGLPLTAAPGLYGECAATPQPPPAPPIPGDCGEGIHLLSADNSTVVGNQVLGNSGGILLTDENGPTDGNVIAYNNVTHNLYDCGVTVAGHNIAALGGVYNNTILANTITNNGTSGQGAGVIFATPVPGSPATYGTGGAVYDNLVEGNYISGNGLGGVTVHSHSTGQDLNGNTIRGNIIGTNNLDPDQDFAFAGPQFVDGQTTGVVVATLSNITITVASNLIVNDADGVWLGEVFGATVTLNGAASNVFAGVGARVVTET